MPWTPGDAARHNHAAASPAKSALWSGTANAVLKDSGDEGKAIRIANAQVAGTINHAGNHKRKKSKLHGISKAAKPAAGTPWGADKGYT